MDQQVAGQQTTGEREEGEGSVKESSVVQRALTAGEGLKTIVGEEAISDLKVFADEVTLMVNREALKRVLSLLKENFGFAMLIDATAVDWLKRGEPRFEVVYHLLSLSHRTRLRIKVAVASTDAWVPCICDIYPNASPYEREIWDMFGIFIDGHKNLKRILTYEEFPGHPLRKDFPLFWQPGEPVEVEEEKNDEW